MEEQIGGCRQTLEHDEARMEAHSLHFNKHHRQKRQTSASGPNGLFLLAKG